MITRTPEFTGRHMLITTVTFFGVVITVNVTMAYLASSSWSGLVVENTYVASQEFNGKAAAMKAMAASGIVGSLSLKDNAIHYDLRNRDGTPADVDEVVANFKRPVGDHEDFKLALRQTAKGRFEAVHPVSAGDWIVEVTSRREGALVMHEATRIDTAGLDQ
ncbi:cation transporter [Neorhizobium lilium]|uniref:Cation transporter n=1 Tax=Neorhizobium lilium TaxID=2503024 RepID=A0A3S3T2S4_9HYPH|nr:FixH family protein [Neorhizobium lilium]RWX80770.1 cation transporter [Neorhizobium lilium]